MMEKNEVIGFLGGWFDKQNRVLYVQVRRSLTSLVRQSVRRSEPVSQSASRSAFNRPVSLPTCQPASQPVSQPASQSVETQHIVCVTIARVSGRSF